jgi:hypothetical protein
MSKARKRSSKGRKKVDAPGFRPMAASAQLIKASRLLVRLEMQRRALNRQSAKLDEKIKAARRELRNLADVDPNPPADPSVKF